MQLDQDVKQIILASLREDQSRKDVTTRLLIRPDRQVTGQIVAKQDAIVCGTGIAREIFKKINPKCAVRLDVSDGTQVSDGQTVLTVKGSAKKLLSAERTALNFIQHLSGVASFTNKFVQAVAGTRAKIYDTRKTIPGLRTLQKYAVRCGGGQNHRLTLAHMAMVKDNHLAILSEDREIKLKGLKNRLPRGMTLLVEAKTLAEVQLALDSGADIILLDNMPVPNLKEALRFIASKSSRPLIEVSGGITLSNVRQIAALGVDRISIGAITHSAPAADFSLEIDRGHS